MLPRETAPLRQDGVAFARRSEAHAAGCRCGCAGMTAERSIVQCCLWCAAGYVPGVRIVYEGRYLHLIWQCVSIMQELISDSMQNTLDHVRFDRNGLVVAVVQDHATGEVLMVAYMNAATLRQTLETGTMTYWSRSRQCVWVKGATSGNLQEVREVRLDCDGDALLFSVVQHGGTACHAGERSCFYRKIAQ